MVVVVVVGRGEVQFLGKEQHLAKAPFLTIDPGAKCQAKMFCYLASSRFDVLRTGLCPSRKFTSLVTNSGVTQVFSAYRHP